MSRINTFLIGRHRQCDLRLDHSSVSRKHAEVVPLADGRFYITDRSSSGTFVWTDRKWKKIRQTFIKPGDRLRLGRLEIIADHLDVLRAKKGGRASGSANSARAAGRDIPDPRQKLMRNPETGEIIEKPP